MNVSKEPSLQAGLVQRASWKVGVFVAAAVIAATAIVALWASGAFAAESTLKGTLDSGGATYEYTIESGEATITGISKAAGNTADTYEAIIPESITVDGTSYLVTKIGQAAIGETLERTSTAYKVVNANTQLTRVVIPSKVLEIEARAFAGCTALTQVEFATDEDGNAHLETLGDYAFYGSTHVQEWILPDSLTQVGTRPIQANDAVKVKLPASNTNYAVLGFEPYGRLYNCTELIVPEGCATLPRIEAPKLTHLVLPSTLTHAVYLNVPGIETLDFSGNNQIDDLTLQVGNSFHAEIPEGVQTLALYGGDGDVKLPSTLKEIDALQVSNLKQVSIPQSVTTIGTYAFSRDSLLESIVFEEGSQLTSIDMGAFNGCSGLNGIDLPEGLLDISNRAFEGCSSLKTVVLPKSVSAIGGYPFSECDALESIVFERGATSFASTLGGISGLARECPNLKSIVMSEAYTSAAYTLATGCPNLKDVYFYAPSVALQGTTFSDCGTFTVHGWGTAGKLVDTCENLGIPFEPYAELDGSEYNGAANVTPTIENGNLVLTCSFTTPVNNKYTRTLTWPSDCTVASDGDDWVVTGNGFTSYGTLRVAKSRSLANATIDPIAAQVYSGSACEPTVTVRYGGEVLAEGRDYTVSYTDNDHAGTARATVAGKGGYTGQLSATFEVVESYDLATGGSAISADDAHATATSGKQVQSSDVVVAWAHDAAGSALAVDAAAASGAHLLLVSNQAGFDQAQLDALTTWGASHAYLVGGAAACGQGVASQLKQLGVSSGEVNGADAASLARAVRGAFPFGADMAFVANPSDAQSAVVAAAYAGAAKAPIVYTNDDGTLAADDAAYVGACKTVVLVGDEAAVDASAEDAAPAAVRIAGVTPEEVSAGLASWAIEQGVCSAQKTVRLASWDTATASGCALSAARIGAVLVVK